MKQMVFKDLLSNPKNGTIYFGAQMKGWLEILEHNGKSDYDCKFNLRVRVCKINAHVEV